MLTIQIQFANVNNQFSKGYLIMLILYRLDPELCCGGCFWKHMRNNIRRFDLEEKKKNTFSTQKNTGHTLTMIKTICFHWLLSFPAQFYSIGDQGRCFFLSVVALL